MSIESPVSTVVKSIIRNSHRIILKGEPVMLIYDGSETPRTFELEENVEYNYWYYEQSRKENRKAVLHEKSYYLF